MGSSNRDYMQDEYESGGGPTWGHDFPTTKWLLISTVIVFFLETLTVHDVKIREQRVPIVAGVISDQGLISPASVRQIAFGDFDSSRSYVEDWFELDAIKVLRGQVWRLVSYVFCHQRQNPLSLVFNMLMLYYFGSSLERMYGSREILWFYLTSGFVCGLVFVGFRFVTVLPLPMVGASACVIALLTLYATHFPREEIIVFWLVPVQIRVLLIIYAIVDVYWIAEAYSGQASWTLVAYSSHLWGIAFGYLYRRMNWHLRGIEDLFDFGKLQRSIRRATSQRKLKVYQPEPMTNLDEQVDAILAKIHEKGSESLTDRERSILQKASEQAKNRQ